MSAKMGRPKAEKPKDIKFSIRLDMELNEKLEKFCEEHSIIKAEAIRQGIKMLLEQKK